MLRSPERGLRGITREKAPRPWVRELQVHLGQQSTQAGSGQGQHVTEVLSLILPALYLGCAIWWDCLAQTPPSIPELQLLAEATQIGEPASSSAEVRQLVDHLSEQAREAASTLMDLTLFTFSRSLYYITSNRSDGTDIDLTKLV